MMENTKILGLQFETEINRSDYKVGVGDTAEVTINMELNRKNRLLF